MKKPYYILLVEDDKADQEIIKRSLNEIKDLNYKLLILENGVDFVKYIEDNSNVYPDLILLDLNLPKMNGKEALDKLDKIHILNRVIIILTTSKNQEDIDFVYKKGVKSFITKPSSLKEFNSMIESLKCYWLDTVILPKKIKNVKK